MITGHVYWDTVKMQAAALLGGGGGKVLPSAGSLFRSQASKQSKFMRLLGSFWLNRAVPIQHATAH